MDQSISLTEKLNPVRATERLEFVDVLRGFAIFGILVVNMSSFAGYPLDPSAAADPLDSVVLLLTRFLFVAKFYSLFSFLFGWGMAVQMQRAQARSKRFAPVYLRRVLILLFFGLVHGIFIWSGDILTLYAVLGAMLLLFRRASPRVLLLAFVLCLLLSILLVWPGETIDAVRDAYAELTAFLRPDRYPGSLYATGTYPQITRVRLEDFLGANSWFLYYFGNVFGMFLVGLYFGRRRIFQDFSDHRIFLQRLMWVCLPVGLAFNAIFTFATPRPEWLPVWYGSLVSTGARTLGAPALTMFYVCALVLLYHRGESWRQRLAPLAPVGRMALSNYIFQSLVATLIFYGYGLGLYGEIGAVSGLVLAVILYLVQIRLSAWWFDRYRFGPLEALWRSLTYGRWQPLRVGYHFEQPSVDNPKQRSWLLFILVWLVLLVWGVGLLAWRIRLQARMDMVSPIVVQVTPTPQALTRGGQADRDFAPETGLGDASLEPGVSVPRQFEPLTYRPGPLAASGDMAALARQFDGRRALEFVEILAAPRFEGRYAGSPGGQAAAETIAGWFAEYGLQPAGDEGAYFQNFSVAYTPLNAAPRLAIQTGGVWEDAYLAYVDFAPLLRDYAGAGGAEGPVYWGGTCESSALAGLPVVDTILLCAPSELSFREVSRYALEHGAAGLLMLAEPETRPPDLGLRHELAWVPEPLPMFYVYSEVVVDLLAGSGISRETLLNHEPVQLSSIAHLQIETEDNGVCPGPECPARNVLGVLPGRDPRFAGEVVILGAHYDHVGSAPGGIIWSGANDNASGVGVLLELARAWQAEGFVPRRTILFAAWDAEELGLLGAEFYIKNPVFPLDRTVAMFQLDMVGAGTEELVINGSDHLQAALAAAAGYLDIPYQFGEITSSDHGPFLRAGVPASLLIWWAEGGVIPHYHRPDDTPEVIERDKLQAIGELVGLTALGMSESEPAIYDLVASRTAALQSGDLQAFLETSSPNQAAADRLWFSDFESLNTRAITLTVGDLRTRGPEIAGRVQMEVQMPAGADGSEVERFSVELDARFARGLEGWQWDGADLTREEVTVGDGIYGIKYAPGLEADWPALIRQVRAQYAALARPLGLPENLQAGLSLYTSSAALRAGTALSLPEDVSAWTGPGELKLVYSPAITESMVLQDSLVQLLLAEAGVPRAVAPWLWEGLPLVMQGRDDPVAIQSRHLPALMANLEDPAAAQGPANAWAAVEYIRMDRGWPGLGELIVRLGQACQVEGCDDEASAQAAIQSALGQSPAAFEAAWRAGWQTRLEAAQAQLARTLQARQTAVLSGDEAAFLATVDPANTTLLAEQRNWFAALDRETLQRYELTAQPLAFLADGGVLVNLQTSYALSGALSDEGVLHERVVFSPAEGAQVLYAGPHLESLHRGEIEIRFPAGQRGQAEELAAWVLEIAPDLAAQLQASSGRGGGFLSAPSTLSAIQETPLSIIVYEDTDTFRTSIALDFPTPEGITGWTNSGEGIKLLVEPGFTVEELYNPLALQMARRLLLQQGVKSEWLLKGASAYLARRVSGGAVERRIDAYLPALHETVQNQGAIHFEKMPPDPGLTKLNRGLMQAQALDSVRYLVAEYGWEKLLALFGALGQSQALEPAFVKVFGLSTGEFQVAWERSFVAGHLSAESRELAQAFDAAQADLHVRVLTQPRMAGRLAGSSGAELAAEYLANRFAAYGLLPAGDLARSSSGAGDFFQRFPISYTEPSTAPRLEVLTLSGDPLVALRYREDFQVIGLPEGEDVLLEGDILWWVANEAQPYQGAPGTILLGRSSGVVETDLEHSAAAAPRALLLVGSQNEETDIYGKDPPVVEFALRTPVPIFELTAGGYRRLLEATGQTMQSVRVIEPWQALGYRIRLGYDVPAAITAETVNVLGLLPGRDPVLRDEIIVIGAHYDHVGDDPPALLCPDPESGMGPCLEAPGLRYSGANDNAGGVAALLEIARLLQETGYRPRRSILFAAWGGQELGELGSSAFLAQPTLPPENVLLGLVQLDGVGGGGGFNPGVQGLWEEDGRLLLGAEAAEDLLQEGLLISEPHDRSDQVVFERAQIPAVLYAWRLADDSNLPDGYANRVTPDRMAAVGRLALLTLLSLAQ